MSAIFDQEKTIAVAQRAKLVDVAREAKVVDRQNGPHIPSDLGLEVGPVWFAVPADSIKLNLRTEVLDRLNCRRAKISRDQDLLTRLDPQGPQAMKNRIA